MIDNIKIPKSVSKAFPLLSKATYIRRFASLVPLAPDTIFDIFMTEAGHFIALVTTDYADPSAQSQELKKVSGQYEFEFTNLLKPYSNDQAVEIFEHDEIDNTQIVHMEDMYYYVAHLSNIK